MEPAFEEADLSVMRRTRLSAALLVLGSVGIATWFVSAALGKGSDLLCYVPGVLLGLASLLDRPRFDPAKVRADARGLTVGDRFVPRGAIRDAFVAPHAVGPPRVVVRRKLAPRLVIQVRDEAEGVRLLHAIGFDVTRTSASFWAIPRGRAGFGNLALTGLGLVASIVLLAAGSDLAQPALAWLVPRLGLLGIIGSFAAVLVPARIVVGAEGVTLRWLGLRRFFRYDALHRADPYSEGGGSSAAGVLLVPRAGKPLRVPIGTSADDVQTANMIAERIHEARAVYERHAAEIDAQALERRGQSHEEWIARLRAIGAGATAGFRAAVVPRDRLFALALSPRADPSARAAAAVALGTALDDDGRARIRAAAASTAIPALRIAIERAADGAPDEALQEALATVESAAEELAPAERRRA